jgi:hypothetical protein
MCDDVDIEALEDAPELVANHWIPRGLSIEHLDYRRIVAVKAHCGALSTLSPDCGRDDDREEFLGCNARRCDRELFPAKLQPLRTPPRATAPAAGRVRP